MTHKTLSQSENKCFQKTALFLAERKFSLSRPFLPSQRLNSNGERSSVCALGFSAGRTKPHYPPTPATLRSQDPKMGGVTLLALLGSLAGMWYLRWQQQKIQTLSQEKERAEEEAAQWRAYAGGWQQQKIQNLSQEKERAEEEAAQWRAYAAERSQKPWVVALVVALLSLLGLLAWSWWQQKKIQALSQEKEWERACKEAAKRQTEAAEAEREAAQKEKEVAQWEKKAAQAKEQQERRAKEKLQDELRWTKIPYLPPKAQAQAYAELKTALFQPEDVFLDPDTAHPNLLVSEDKRSVQHAETWQNLPEYPKRFCANHCVLGCESFTSGRHFWEVHVGERKDWCVGVCREGVRRKRGVKIAPENGFWTVGLNPGNDYLTVMDPQTPLTSVSPPERVGVFLDYELGKVSFYDALDGSHLFTFPPTSFSGPLRPVFCILGFDPTPLTICPA